MQTAIEDIHTDLNIDNRTAKDTLRWALTTFGNKIGIASSFGAEDVVLIDMAVKINPAINIFTLDTGRLHRETYELIEEIQERYNINIEVRFPDNNRVKEMVETHGVNLFYQNSDMRKLCCRVRKIEPLLEKLKDLDAWVCGLRQEQSVTRTDIHKIETDQLNNIIKINPLADWTDQDVWTYIRKHNVPFNKLHERGYPSIGCEPCTRAISTCEEIRAGRWWWEEPEKKECGLHGRRN